MSRWEQFVFAKQLNEYECELPGNVVSHCYVSPLLRQGLNRLLPKSLACSWNHRADGLFDRLAAKHISKINPNIVVGYENACLHTFQAAKRRGVTTVLDAASFHHAWQDRFAPHVESKMAHRRITARKDREIGLADYVVTCSKFARESYEEAGCDQEKMVCLPVGVDCDLFQPSHSRSTSPLVRFIYVGNASFAKGLEVLATAIRLLRSDDIDFEMSVIGLSANAATCLDGLGVRRLGRMPHSELAIEFHNHDVLVLPSRFDSFGMVVAEAMACGLSAIVSDHVGAKEMIQNGQNGFITPAGDPEALATAMRRYTSRQVDRTEMAGVARSTALQYDWRSYRAKAVQMFSKVMNL